MKGSRRLGHRSAEAPARCSSFPRTCRPSRPPRSGASRPLRSTCWAPPERVPATGAIHDEELSFDLDTPADLERWRRRRGAYRALLALPVPGIGEVTAGTDLATLIPKAP